MELEKIIDEIKEAQNIVITAHINPDGDCLGSAIALMLILDRYNKKNFNDEIYKMIDLLDITLDKEIATFLYLGIINDTGNFTHSNVTAETFLTASKLMRQDINNNDITDILFGTSMGKARLLGKVYENKIINEELKFIYFYLPNEELVDLKIGKDETDGISEILLDIEGVEASLFVREESDGKVKGSLRSKHYYNVNETAGLFNGGGHIKAAGFNTTEKFTEIIEKIEKNLKEQLTKLSS